MKRTLFDPGDRASIVARLRRLSPESPWLWGRMTAPRMVAHLTDQMYHGLGDRPCRPVRSILRWPPLRYAAIYLIPWPKGRAKGPPGPFLTQPADWASDLDALIGLVERFGASDPGSAWPDHAIFGRMSGADWGCGSYKHFDHHLRQFGE